MNIRKCIMIVMLLFCIFIFAPSKVDAAMISGTIFNDKIGEATLENVTVILYDKSNNEIKSVTTNQNGEYEFTELAEGEYYIKVDDEYYINDVAKKEYEYSTPVYNNGMICAYPKGNDVTKSEPQKIYYKMDYIYKNQLRTNNISLYEYTNSDKSDEIVSNLYKNPGTGFERLKKENKSITCIWVDNNIKNNVQNSLKNKRWRQNTYFSNVCIPLENVYLEVLDNSNQKGTYYDIRQGRKEILNRIFDVLEIMQKELEEKKYFENDKTKMIDIQDNHEGNTIDVNIAVKKIVNTIIPTTGETEIVCSVLDKNGNLITKKVNVQILEKETDTIAKYEGNECNWIIENGKLNAKVNLEKQKKYFIKYIFTEDAWNSGYSPQEYSIKNSDYSSDNCNDENVKTLNAIEKKFLDPNTVFYSDIETDLDTYSESNTIVGETSVFTINEWYDENLQQNKITSQINSTLKLEENENFEVKLRKKIAAVKVVLADGNIFELKNENDLKQSPNDISNIIFMDDEIMHGATVYVEYEIIAANVGDIEVEQITILDYLDFKYGKIAYDENTVLITDPQESNKTQGWVQTNKLEVQNENWLKDISEIATDDKTLVYAELNSSDFDSITNTAKKRIVTSQIITTDTDAFYQNVAEIVSYKNSIGKRNGKWETNIASSYNRAGYGDADKGSYRGTRIKTNDIIILPPFGDGINRDI